MLGPAHTRSGPGEDMTKQPSPALLDPHNLGELETISATRPRSTDRHRRDQEPPPGLQHHYPNPD